MPDIHFTRIIETTPPYEAEDETPEPEYDSTDDFAGSFRDMVRVIERGGFDVFNPGFNWRFPTLAGSLYAYDSEPNYRTGEETRESLHPSSDAFSARWFDRAVRYVAHQERRRMARC